MKQYEVQGPIDVDYTRTSHHCLVSYVASQEQIEFLLGSKGKGGEGNITKRNCGHCDHRGSYKPHLASALAAFDHCLLRTDLLSTLLLPKVAPLVEGQPSFWIWWWARVCRVEALWINWLPFSLLFNLARLGDLVPVCLVLAPSTTRDNGLQLCLNIRLLIKLNRR